LPRAALVAAPSPSSAGGTGQADHRRGLRLARRQAGQPRAIAVEQLESAARAAVAVNGDARGRQRVDVAIDGAFGHLEFAGEIGRGEPLAQLQQDQDREEAARSHFFAVAESN
jgi:hypothetical protein